MNIGTLKLFISKFKTRLDYLFRLRDLWKEAKQQTQRCGYCGIGMLFEYSVSDKLWNRLPPKWQNNALCIDCFLRENPIATISDLRNIFRMESWVEKQTWLDSQRN